MQIGIVGKGRVGSALLRNLPGSLGVTDFNSRDSLVQACDVIFITVPDRAIEEVANVLAKGKLEGKTFFHCSGSLGVENLSVLAKHGAQVGSLHPLQSFGSLSADFVGVYMALAGSSQAQKIGKEIAGLLGAKTFYVPEAERRLYHAAACLASNYVVTLVSEAQSIISKWTGDDKAALEALLPLLAGTLHNLQQTSLAATTLTGPIGRGDIATVVGHLEVLPQKYHEVYKALGTLTVNIAEQNKSITEQQARSLKKIL